MSCDTGHFEKAPGSHLDYAFDWSAWLGATDKLQAVSFSAEPGLTVESYSHTEEVATVWLQGGELAHAYKLACTIQTYGGRKDKRTASMLVKPLGECAASRSWRIPQDPNVYGPPPVALYA